ncbi:MAG: GNAT family N-acetyltransferase [Planctomycetota bacterium]
MFEVRVATVEDARAIARVHVESWRTTYAGLLPESYLEALTVEEKATFWRAVIADRCETALFVAVETDGEVIGFASGGLDREDNRPDSAELYTIYLFADRQRQGAGRALFVALARELIDRGYQRLRLWVVAANADARRFYRGLGGVTVGQKVMTLAGVDLDKIAYRWDDLGRFRDE